MKAESTVYFNCKLLTYANIRLLYRQSTADLNSEFSISRANEPSLSYYSSMAG